MTEAEWPTCIDFRAMLRHLRRRKRSAPSLRKWRLFACACCRRIPSLMAYEGSGPKVELAERYADGEVSDEMLRRAAADKRGYAAAHNCAEQDIRYFAEYVADDILNYAGNIAEIGAANKAFARQMAEQGQANALALLAHDIFGNPFCPPGPLDLAILEWNNGTVPRVARASYEERALPAGQLDVLRLRIVADALEEAGCADADILNHLRQPCPHVRGCWALDWLLCKE
jgi:hypothetical protein